MTAHPRRRHRSREEDIVEEQEIYAAIGQAGFERLVAAFYRQVPADSILGPMYAGRDMAAAEARLRGFLIYRFGGPPNYIEERGHPRLRMRHNPFAINQAASESWMRMMRAALDEANLPDDARVALQGFFESTATFLINRAE
jgi:hemoglobin